MKPVNAMSGALLCLSLFTIAGAAAVIEIPLPELAGDYDRYNWSVTVPFDLGFAPAAVNQASIHLVGHLNWGIYIYDGEQYSWCAGFIASFMEADPGFWMASINAEGDFDAICVFDDLFGATWDFLLDGQGVLTFEFAPCALFPEAIPLVWPTGSISSARLILDVLQPTGLPLPSGSSSFSQLKALY